MVTLIAPRKTAGTATTSGTLARGTHTPVDATSGALTMTLPTNAPVGVEISVEKVDASANSVIASGNLRGTASTIPLTSQYESRTFLSEGGGSWRPTSDHRTKASLDAAYVTVSEAPLSFLDPRVGGVLDGSTNNDAAFTRAWALMPNGGKLFMPVGYCQVSAITVPTHCHIVGAGEASVIRRANGTTKDLITLSGPKSSLRDLAVDGFIATSPLGGDAVVMNGPYQTLDNVIIYNTAGSGVRVGKGADASSAQLRNLRINLCRGYGIYTTGTTTLDGVYQNISVAQSGLTGLRLDAGAQYLDKIHAWGNGLESASDNHGIWLASAQNKLINCQAESNNGYGIFGGTNSAHGQSIIGGDQWGNGFGGIYLFGTRGHVIQGVTLRNNGIVATSSTDQRGSGLRLDAVTEAVVQGCSARDEGAVIAAGSYPSGYVPSFPFPGRTSTFRQTYAMTEVNACNLNTYVGNIIPASRTRSGVSNVWLGAGNVTAANIT